MTLNRRTDPAKESGAVAVVAAISLTVFMLMAALVIDLGFLRSDRIATKAVADMAAAAAASVYEPAVDGGALDACLAAVRYANANVRAVDITTPESPESTCEEVFTDVSCPDLNTSGTTARYRQDEYQLRITIPVPDGHSLLEGFEHDDYDGLPCQRVGIELSRESSPFFAGFVGDDTRTVVSSTVGRVSAGPFGEDYASLVVLQPSGCATIQTDGGSQVLVEGLETADEYFPGTITVDTADACASPTSGRIFQPSSGTSTSGDYNGVEIAATDGIFSNGLRLGAPRVLPDNAGVRIDPIVVGGEPLTRLLIDDRFNCMDPYPEGPAWSPASHPQLPEGQRGCDAEDEASSPYPFINELHGVYQGLNPVSARAAGWSVYPDDLEDEGAACRDGGQGSTQFTLGPSPNVTGSGDGTNWFINCDGTSQARTLQPNGLEFRGVEAVLSSGPIEVTDSLVVTGSTNQGAIVYLQSGNFERSSNTSTIELRDTFVYLQSGAVEFNSSSATPLIWEAPLGDVIASSCDDYGGGAPPAGCFSPLALWSNSSSQHDMSGGVQLTIAGSFFTPNARFVLGGGNNQTLNRAQFFTGALRAGGNSQVTLMPNPDTNVPTPARDLRTLIR